MIASGSISMLAGISFVVLASGPQASLRSGRLRPARRGLLPRLGAAPRPGSAEQGPDQRKRRDSNLRTLCGPLAFKV